MYTEFPQINKVLIYPSLSYWQKASRNFILMLDTIRTPALSWDGPTHWLLAVLFSHPEWKRPEPGRSRTQSPRRVRGDGRVGRHGQGAASAAEAGVASPRLPAALHTAAPDPSASLGQGQGTAGRHGSPTGPVCGDRRTKGGWSFIETVRWIY